MAEQTLTIKLDVIDAASSKLRQFKSSVSEMKRDMAAPIRTGAVPAPALPSIPRFGPVGGAGGGGGGGMAGMLGSGGIGNLAGLTIVGGAILGVLKKSYDLLAEASPYLKAIGAQFGIALNMFLRPLGDSLAKALSPVSEYAIEQADAMAEFVESADEQFGVIGAAIATYFSWQGMQYAAVGNMVLGLGELVWNTISGLGQWIFDSISGVISGGISSLADFGGWVLDSILDALGPLGDDLRGIGGWLWEKITGVFTAAWNAISGLGPWLWNGITGIFSGAWGAISGFGTWLWNSITGALTGAWNVLSGLGSNLFNSIWNSIKGIGNEAYKAFHNAIATMLNAISNIELPLIGKPFKGLLGTIPMLASGGIVTSPTLAMIGESGPEAVIPLNRGGGMDQPAILNVYGNIYGVDDLERAFSDWYSKNQTGYSTYR